MDHFKKEWSSPFYILLSTYDTLGNIYAMYIKSEKIVIFNKHYKYKKVLYLRHPEFKKPDKKLPVMTNEKAVKKWLSQFVVAKQIFIVKDKFIVVSYERYFADKENYLDILTTNGKILINRKRFPYRLIGKDKDDYLYFYDYKETEDDIQNIIYKYEVVERGLK